MKIIFAGTPEFAAVHLKALLQTSHSICAVYTQPDRPKGRGQQLQASAVKELALQHSLPIMQPKTLRDLHEQKIMAEFEPDLMIVAAYGLILPQAVLDIPRWGCLNIHASILPRWRGAAPIQHAILAGDTETGITIMQMAAGLDTGDMLYKSYCPIYPSDTSGSLHDRLASLGPSALLHTLNQLEVDQLKPEKQDEAMTCYAHKIEKQQANIDWKKSATDIDRLIRAFYPVPISFTHYQGTVIRIWSADKVEKNHTAIPGTILAINSNELIVAAADQAIALKTIQLAGGKALPMAEILRGHHQLFKVGNVFSYEAI